jgi:hypothetical protein
MFDGLEEVEQKIGALGWSQPELPASVSILEIPLLTDIVEIEYQE